MKKGGPLLAVPPFAASDGQKPRAAMPPMVEMAMRTTITIMNFLPCLRNDSIAVGFVN